MAEATQLRQFSDTQARDFWTSVYSNQQAGIIILRNGIIIHTNDAGAKIAGGKSPEEFIGLSPAEAFVTPEFMDLVQQSLQQLNQSGKSIPPTEIRINCVDGTQKDLLISATSWQYEDSTVVEATFFDITVFSNRGRLLEALQRLSLAVLQTGPSSVNPKELTQAALRAMAYLYAERHNCGFISLDPSNSFLKESGVLLSDKGPLVTSHDALSAASIHWIVEHLDSDILHATKNRRSFRIPISDTAWGRLFLSLFSLEETLYGYMFWLFPSDSVSELIENDEDRRDRFLQVAAMQMTAFLSQQTKLQQASNLAVLYRLVRELGRIVTLNDLAQITVEILEKEKGWCPSFMRFRSRSNQTLESFIYHGCLGPNLHSEDQKSRFPDDSMNDPDKGITGYVIQQGIPLRSLDLQADPHYVEIEPGMRYGVFAPITIDSVVESVIGVESADYAFTQEDLDFLCSVAEVVGIGIKSIRLIEILKERVQWLEVLHRLNEQIGTNVETEKLYQLLVDSVMEPTGADAAALLIYKSTTGLLEAVAAQGWLKKVYEKPFRKDEGLVGFVFGSGHTYISPNLRQDPFLLARSRPFVPDPSSSISVPVKNERGTSGVFTLAVKDPSRITKELVQFVEMFGSYCGIVLGRSEQIQELRQAKDEVAQAYDETLRGWARALGYRDSETFEHTERVTELSSALGKALGLEERQLEALRRGAILHDIGKIGIPDAILGKPGALTEEEQAVMRTHAAFAYELLKPIDFLKDAVVVPYCHHEHWDGSGYPRGLKGEQIPLLARIFTVADVYDALTSDRPYRAAWTKEQTLDYIRSQSGKIFDPHIVEVFLSVIETV